MKASELRQYILADHLALRGILDHVAGLADELAAGDRQLAGPLRVAAEELLDRLERHMRWEDSHLAPALRDADAWGEERARRLDRDHREQRELLAHTLDRIRDHGRPAVVLARGLRDLVQLLRDDMHEEEVTLLDPRVLRDDVISLDPEPE
jgi:hypothetical protein